MSPHLQRCGSIYLSLRKLSNMHVVSTWMGDPGLYTLLGLHIVDEETEITKINSQYFFAKKLKKQYHPFSLFVIPVSKIYYQEKKKQSSINCLVLKKESHTGSQG